MVDRLIAPHLDRYKTSGAELIMGESRFVSPKTLEVHMKDATTRLVEGDRVFLNVGSRAAIPDAPGLKAARPLTHIEALELDRVPEHWIVLGGGFVRGEDPDVAQELLRVFQAERVDVLLETNVIAVEGLSGQQVSVHVSSNGSEPVLEATQILVASGGVPNTDRLDLDKTASRWTGMGGDSTNRKRQLGIRYPIARIPAAAVLRTRTLSETQGLLKAIISTENDEILGFTALCTQAGELMSVVQTAMLSKLPYTALRDAIFAHPTMAEGLTGLFAAVPAQSSAGARMSG